MEYITAQLIDHIAINVPWLGTVDEDCGQLEALANESEDRYPLTFPAVLINIDSVDWSNIADGGQTGQANIRVRLLIDCYDDMHAGAMGKEKAAERQALCRQVNSTVSGFRPTGEGGLLRNRSAYFVGFHGIKVYDQFYTLTINEATNLRGMIAASRLKLSLKASPASPGSR